jgi:hypothetical protein
VPKKTKPAPPATPAPIGPDGKPLTGLARSLANLTPFRKGESGNPKGRPKVMTNSIDFWLSVPVPDEMLIGKLELLKGTGITFADLCGFNIVMTAAMPSMRNPAASVAAFKEVSDRIDGPVRQQVKVDHTVTDITDDAIMRRLRELTGQIPTIEGEVISETISEKQLDGRAKPLQLHDGESGETFNTPENAHSDVCLVDEGEADPE